MNNDIAAVKTEGARGLDGMDARRNIKRIADAVVDQRISTEVLLTAECSEVANEHYVEIGEVFDRVWQKVDQDPRLHPTHPAGKTEAYHMLRKRADR